MDKVMKIFSFILIKKRVLFPVLLFFVALGLLFPFSPAYAFLGPLAWLFMGAIAWMVMAFILSLTNIILWFAGIMLMWSIDPWFIRVPYTSGGIVDIGWPVVRDLANMGIVLALVFIGLATALRLKEYQAQKTLPLLIGIALLINFTPVILGVIVDAANIVMNFFLAELTGGEALFRQFQALGSMISSELGGIQWLNPLQHWTLAFKILVMAIFNIFAAIIFLLFAFLFIFRRIAIWMLVILSPLAFVAYIFPGKPRGFFTLWWNQFTQWTIIGIAGAFFLWLGEQMIILAAAGGFVSEVPGVAGGFLQEPITDIISGIAPYFIALLFLLIGFFTALSTSAMGASGIIAGVQRGTRTLTKAAGTAGVATARGVPAVSRTEARIRQRLERTPGLSALVGGPGAYAAELERDRKKAGRSLGAESVGRLREFIRMRPMSREGRLTRAAAIEELAKRDRLEIQDTQYFGEAIQHGVSPRMLYGKMPSAAVAGAPGVPPGMTTEESIRGHVERQETREFRRNAQPQAFGIVTPPPAGAPPGTPPTFTSTPENLQVFYSMDTAKVAELGRTGSRHQKEALRKLTQTQTPAIITHINDLVAAGGADNIDEARKIFNMWRETVTNPNYRT